MDFTFIGYTVEDSGVELEFQIVVPLTSLRSNP